MFHALARLVFRHRPLATLLLVLLVGGLGLGVKDLTADFSARAFFGTASPELEFLDAHEARWGSQDDTVLVVVSVAEGDLLSRARLEELQGLRDELESNDASVRVLGPSDHRLLSRPAPGIVLPVPLLDSMPHSPERQAAWREQALADPALVPRMMSEDGSKAAILLEMEADGDDIEQVREAVDALQVVVDAHQGQQGLSLAIAGIPAVRAGLIDVLIRDQSFFVSLAIVIIAVLLILLFRRVHGLTIPLLAAAVPALMTFGLMGWMGEPVGLINNTYATLIPVIAVADAVHMITRFHEEQRKLAPPGERLTREQTQQAILAAMGRVGAACMLTSLTTAIGFLSLCLAEMQTLKSFGLYAAAGIVFAYITVLLVVPLALSITNSPVDHAEGESWLDRMLDGCAHWSTRRPWTTLGLTGAVLLAAGALSLRVEVDNWLTAILPEAHSASVANTIVDRELGGLVAVEIDLTGGDLRSPQALQAIQDATDALEGLPSVRAIESPAQVVLTASQMMGGPRQIPTDAAFVDRLLAQLDEVTATVLTQDHARIIVRSQDVGANGFGELAEQVEARTRGPLLEAGLTPTVTGTSVVAYAGINAVTRDLRDSLLAAFFVIALVISGLFRSVRTGLLSMIPNAAPLLLGYATLGAMGWFLDPAPAVVFTVALGIAVDDTIHLLARFHEERDAGRGWTESIHQAVRHSGRAVFVTSVMLTFGFGVNVWSSFPGNTIFGAVGAVIIVGALACDIFVLPALLQIARPRPA